MRNKWFQLIVMNISSLNADAFIHSERMERLVFLKITQRGVQIDWNFIVEIKIIMAQWFSQAQTKQCVHTSMLVNC